MTIQEIKNAINYDELNSVEIIKTTYESIKSANNGILDILGTDDINNMIMMFRYLAEKSELIRRSTQSDESFEAFKLNFEIFETIKLYRSHENNRVRRLLAAQ